jgi:hypothetical protein
MGGVAILEDMQAGQMAAASGGATLRSEGAPMAAFKSLRRPAARLHQALQSKHLVAPLLVMVGQQRVATLFRNPDVIFHTFVAHFQQ